MSEISSITDLLSFDGDDFIRLAYAHILGRKPDPKGYIYYMRRLQWGYSKRSILYQIYSSPENVRRKMTPPGMMKLILWHKLFELPIINSHLKIKKYKFDLYSAKAEYDEHIKKLKSDHEINLREVYENYINKCAISAPKDIQDNSLEHNTCDESRFSKIVLLSMVKNEADIIESFIRHNCIFFDKIIIIDNQSTDATVAILEKLKDEGIPINIEQDEDLGYSQKEKMTRRYAALVKEDTFDFLVIIDADEFIKSNDRNILRRTLRNKETKYFLEWRNYIPIGIGQEDLSDPLRRISHRNAKKSLRKVVIPNFGDESQFVRIWQGNHDFDFSCRPLHFHLLDTKLAHFPVRSINQIESKAIIGWSSYLIKNKHAKWSHEGLQWRVIYEKIVHSGIADADLSAIADCYSDIENIDFDRKLFDSDFIYDPLTPNYNAIKYYTKPNGALSKAAKYCEAIIDSNWKLKVENDRLTALLNPQNQQQEKILNVEPEASRIDDEDIDGRDLDFRISKKYKLDDFIARGIDPHILFISERKHAKFQTLRYRCFNIIDKLSKTGWNCALTYSDEIDSESFSRIRPLIAVFIRVDRNEGIINLINSYKSDGVKVIFDIDDFVFDEIVFLQKVTVPGISKIPELLNSEWAMPYRDEAKFYQCLMKLADAVTTTTPFLAEKINSFNNNVFVIKNSLSASQIASSSSGIGDRRDDCIRVGYFSGSPTHRADFLIAAEALYKIMRRRREVKLVLVGFFEIPEYFLALGDGRIERHPPLDAAGYFNIIGQCDINIAPLENSVFNQGKSELKAFEAAAWGIPTIASATDTMVRCITDGYNGIIARDSHSWELALDKLAADSSYRIKMGTAAKDTIAEDFSFEKSGEFAEIIYNRLLGKL